MENAQELRKITESKRISQLDAIYKSMEQAASKGEFKSYWYDKITDEEVTALRSAGYKVNCHYDQRDGYTNTISW